MIGKPPGFIVGLVGVVQTKFDSSGRRLCLIAISLAVVSFIAGNVFFVDFARAQTGVPLPEQSPVSAVKLPVPSPRRAVKDGVQEPSKPVGPARGSFAELVAKILNQGERVVLPVRQRKDALWNYYVKNNSQPIWLDGVMARALIARMKDARADGLRSRDYPIEQLERLLSRRRLSFGLRGASAFHAGVELYFSAFFLKYASDLKVGRFLPTKVDSNLYWHEKKIDMVSALTLFSTLNDVDKFVEAWQSKIPAYTGLKASLARYRKIQTAGGWPFVPHEPILKPGMNAPSVVNLRQRLDATVPEIARSLEAGTESIYDEALVAAVKGFQREHGLEDDGVIGKQTLFQLNIPVEDRVRQIILSMERWRWMPEDLGKHYIMVNIAGFQLERVRDQKLEEKMRVVVGTPFHQTPVFSRPMTYVELNPYWNVPASIAINEELARLKKNPRARAAKGFEAMVEGKPVPVTRINWSQYSPAVFPVRLRQKPGKGNALGRVKFMFPNPFSVYMHDTPARGLFGRSQRAFSHGCIRLARPIDLAEQVLSFESGWDRKKITAVVAREERTVVRLTQPLDVHITYSTAWLDDDGRVNFRPDIYGRDKKLYRALFGKPSPY